MRRPPKHAAPAAHQRGRAGAAVQDTAVQATAERRSVRQAMHRWHGWRLSRPFWGAVLTAAGGFELAAAAGAWRWLRGPAGTEPPAASLALAAGLVLCGALLCFHPVRRSAYSTAAVLGAVTALMTDHVGGYLAGSVLGTVGGAIAFAWVPAGQLDTAADAGRSAAADDASQGADAQPPPAGQAPELTLIRGDAAGAEASPPAAQRPLSAPTSALGLSTLRED